MTPDETARSAAARMWKEDRTSQALGLELLEVRPGFAKMRMQVRPEMTNGHGICHGGYIFLLADSTFAFACNTHGQRAVAAGAEIHFLRSAHDGDELVAEGVERHLGGRSGIYDMVVTDQEGRQIALFRGRSATIKGSLVESPDTGPAS